MQMFTKQQMKRKKGTEEDKSVDPVERTPIWKS